MHSAALQAIVDALPQDEFAELLRLRPGFSAETVEKISQKNCENYIGSIEVPVGLAGPVQMNGDEVVLPLATTEGALVASISRGVKAINASGGAQVFVKKIGISRAPVFQCANGAAALEFVAWLDEHIVEFAALCEATSAHLKFLNHQTWVRGRDVYARFVFDPDQAMGMNMVTIAIAAAWEKMHEQVLGVKLISLSSNVCSDKKDSLINRLYGRGYWVQAEVKIPFADVETILKTDATRLYETHVAKNLVGTNLAGSFSQNMHVGNVVAAMYLATGQDMAHVTEGSQASTTVEVLSDSLYVAVTLPNLVLGVVGGGTWLPAQTQARKLIGGGKDITAEELARAVGVAALAAEISGIAALSAQQLAQAHQKLGR